MLYVLSLRRRRGLLCSAGEIRPCPQPISAAAAPADEIPRCQVTRCAVSAQGGLGPRVRVCRIYGHALLLPGTDSCGAAGRLGNLQTGLEARVERHMSARGRERVSTNTVAQRADGAHHGVRLPATPVLGHTWKHRQCLDVLGVSNILMY